MRIAIPAQEALIGKLQILVGIVVFFCVSIDMLRGCFVFGESGSFVVEERSFSAESVEARHEF
jgi:hypothetical protein